MKGSKLTKVGRLLAHLASHPQHIGPYLALGPFCGKSPLELEVPWFSHTAIRFLDGFIGRSMRVFEYGSGGSTIYFAKRAAAVVSTEDHAGWLEQVKATLDGAGVRNVTLQYRPFDFARAEQFDRSSYLDSIPEGEFEVIVVDGREEGVPVRPQCFQHAETRIAAGGIIVVDDAWRYPELRVQNRAKSWREFRSIGPCRPGVTSTDIYFY